MPPRRDLVSTQRGAPPPPAAVRRAPASNIFSPNVRNEASRTTRGGACAPPPPSSVGRCCRAAQIWAAEHRSPTTYDRAGWVGCNIALNRVPAEARIAVVTTILSPLQSSAGVSPAPGSNSSEGRRDACATLLRGEKVVIATPAEVRAQFRRVKPLKDISVAQRGWTLDVLNIVRRLVESRRRGDESQYSPDSGTRTPDPKRSQRLLTSSPTNKFTTADAYTFERELEKLHPDNSDSHREQAATSATTP